MSVHTSLLSQLHKPEHSVRMSAQAALLSLSQIAPAQGFLIKQQMKPDTTFGSAAEHDAIRWLPWLVRCLDFSLLTLASTQPLHAARVWKAVESLNEHWEAQKREH